MTSSPSIAMDRQHVPHIAYIASPFGEDTRLMYASVRSGRWFTETLATGLRVTSTVSIAAGPGGQPFIAYDDGALKLAKRTDDGWQTITVASLSQPGGSEADLAVDNQARAHLAYYDVALGNLMYALVQPAAWAQPPTPPQTMVADSAGDVGQGPSIALDSFGLPHISYYDASRHDLKEAYLLPPATNFAYMPAIRRAK